MPNAVGTLLNKLDLLIAEHGLHNGDPLAPVVLSPLLEQAIVRFSNELATPVFAISVHWDGDAAVAFNSDLIEPERSKDLRHAGAHELGHIIGKHNGYFTLWQAGWGLDPEAAAEVAEERSFDTWTRNKIERECEIAAAYLLVSRRALRMLEGMGTEYIAALLDVPEHLVRRRMMILQDYKR